MYNNSELYWLIYTAVVFLMNSSLSTNNSGDVLHVYFHTVAKFTLVWVNFDLLRKPYHCLQVDTEVKSHVAVFRPNSNFTSGIFVHNSYVWTKKFFHYGLKS